MTDLWWTVFVFLTGAAFGAFFGGRHTAEKLKNRQ